MSEGTNGWHAKDVLLVIVCLPYFCFSIPYYSIARQRRKSRPRYWRRVYRQDDPDHTPVPMIPRSTGSSLTLPLSSVPDLQRSKHKTISQNKCSLLSKLPFELRKVIWEECMGGKVLHLTLAKYDGETHNKLVHIVCLGEPKHERCFNQWQLSQGCYDKANMMTVCPRQDSKFLSLLLTCRKIYSEAIDYLYGSNNFETTVHCIRLLPSLFLPQRLDSIRSLDLRWERGGYQPVTRSSQDDRDFCETDWESSWRIIAGMKSLSVLRVEIEDLYMVQHWDQFRGKRKDRILQPIREVTRPVVFHIQFPFYLPFNRSLLDNLPCSISFAPQESFRAYVLCTLGV